ncbi:Fe-S cluster assembly scaffold protein NifU [Limisalsivibrio acetivorans]|uniref:Fe-S cluster assembly scaffold protein NifU n=1 Tax=Limisalsivibrio acetivorans TaxID=1304888 RepID=UPI0003B71FF5|nr:Fe-S cluster assembly scaffold protein NifU [Limisalsivibrio acetivorans]
MSKGPYSEKVMDHFMNPRNMGEIESANAVGEVGNPACGDVMKIFLDIDDDGIVTEVKFKTFGCGAAIASSSMATELIKGKRVEEVLALTNQSIVESLGGLPPAKIHCSVMAEEAIEAALKDYYERKGEDPSIVDKMKENIKKDNPEGGN